MSTLTYSFYKSGSYGASAGSDDPYFGYNSLAYSGTIGQSTVSAISECKFTNANTNGSSANGYEMEVQVTLNGVWRVLGYITASYNTSHVTWTNFTMTADAATRSLMGKYPPTAARLKVTKGYFHLNAGSTLSVTATMELDYLTSSFSLSKASVDAGSGITATIAMNSPDLSHQFTWKFGSASFTSTAAAGVTAHTVTIPADWLTQIPNAASGAAVVTMQTYAGGTLIGTTTGSFTVTVPADIVPVLADFTVAGVNQYGSLTLKDVSSARATLSGAGGSYGSTITRCQISGNGESAAAYTLTTGVLKTAGQLTFTAQVSDSRGRTAAKTAVLFVTDYSAPRITGTREFRYDSAGAASRTGTYASCAASWQISALTGATATLTIGYQRSSGTWPPDTGYTGQGTSGDAQVIGAGNIAINYGWTIIYTVTDGICSTTVTGRVPSISHFLHFRPGGQGLGIGTTCEADRRVQINEGWGLYVGDRNVMELIEQAGSGTGALGIGKGGTGASTVEGARNNLGLGNTAGAVPIANGGTGAATAAAARNNLGLGNTSGAVPVANGGTGAGDAATARSNLGAAASSHSHGAESITSGTLAAARLPFKYAYGSTTISGSASIGISYASAGFTAVPLVFVTYATTGGNWSGDNGAIKVHSKTTAGCSIVVGGSFSTGRAVDWFAIGT